jgi:hypothetical protein
VVRLLIDLARLATLIRCIGQSPLHEAGRFALGGHHWFRPSRRIGLAYRHHQRVLWRS